MRSGLRLNSFEHLQSDLDLLDRTGAVIATCVEAHGLVTGLSNPVHAFGEDLLRELSTYFLPNVIPLEQSDVVGKIHALLGELDDSCGIAGGGRIHHESPSHASASIIQNDPSETR
ncbi:hypothetical protein ACFQLX_03625 [Streptomyces polyrhachis]|uniref:Uncharacterized protein n=1 Tax=Streptomyces polyrhachis TaxID=1282885 RepID=A0ABW2GCH7_9ACTN